MRRKKKLNNLGKRLYNRLAKTRMKMKVLNTYLSGSFDYYDKNRIKPMSRLRKNIKEINLEKENNLKLRVKDWYSDIENGYSLPRGIKK